MPLFSFSASSLVRPNSLSWLMAGLIVFVIANVSVYSVRSMAGDRNYRRHRLLVILLGGSVLVMVFADHLLLLFAGWVASNLLLVRLMIHKGQWNAARNAGLLALKTFGIGFALLFGGFWLLAESTGSASIHEINSATDVHSTMMFAGLLLIAVTAMTQSAAWPFHRWLISSLNSPTPVSALMHAGLVNGGGFLLVRFAPLYLKQTELLHGVFIVGLISTVVGTFWKLLQPDMKRMLACSTMGQMGFMLMQCGMGLFAPAISHLCWHGLFKAYLFLNAGSAVQEKRQFGSSPGNVLLRFPLACVAGLVGAAAFHTVSGIDFNLNDTSCLMTGLAFMAATQIALGLLQQPLSVLKVVASPLLGLGVGITYGLSIFVVDSTLASLDVTRPQPLDAIYTIGIAVILLIWLVMNLNLVLKVQSLPIWKRLYLAALNASQPHPSTVTATRTAYQI